MTPFSTIKDILEGRALDVPLEAGDIVFVLNSSYRFLRNYVDAILNTFAYTGAANEEINAFGGTQVGLSVPVGNLKFVGGIRADCDGDDSPQVTRGGNVGSRKQSSAFQ